VNGLFVVGGSMPESDGGRLYNTSFVFSPEGKEIARHRKMHLFDINVEGGQRFCESDTFSPGDSLTLFDTPFGRFGLCPRSALRRR
jgi:predicted amidohydrolase